MPAAVKFEYVIEKSGIFEGLIYVVGVGRLKNTKPRHEAGEEMRGFSERAWRGARCRR